MAIKTPKYGLTAFQAGDRYSSVADKKRFTIIDNELAFLSDEITDGRITGWACSHLSGTDIRLSPGVGIIERFITETYGNIDFTLQDNSRYYVYVNRKDASGAKGPFTKPVTIAFTDTTAPSQAVGLTYTSTANTITLHWTANSEIDVDYYNVYKSTDNVSFINVSTSLTNSAVITGLTGNTTYYFKVSAVDFSGNEGTKSSALTATTSTDATIPSDPASVDIFPGNHILQLFWDPAIGSVDHYEASIQTVDNNGTPIGSPTTQTANSTQLSMVIPDLTNGQPYNITLKSVSSFGVKSTGITVTGSPAYHPGPADPINLSLQDQGIDSSGKVGLIVSWDPSNDPYSDTAVYYLVTVAVRNGETGEASVYNSDNITITAYTVNSSGISVIRPILEKTEYIIKVQAVNAAGDSSRGTLGRINTRSFKAPATVSNITFDQSSTTNLRISWTNSVSDFLYNQFSLNVVDLSTNVTTTIASAVDLGQVSFFNVPSHYIKENVRFDVSIRVVDQYNNISNPAVSFYSISQLIVYGTQPPVPSYQDVRGGNGQVVVTWSDPSASFASNFAGTISYYVIWRATYTGNYNAASFSVVGRVPSTKDHFVDYTVDNGTRYVYFVTSEADDGSKSLNPIDDNYYSYPLVTARASNVTDLSAPSDVIISQSGNDANITWTFSSDDFDGYEIYRSEGNNYSYKKIGSVSTTTTAFTDANALLKNGTYYYLIRKFRNDAIVFASKSNIAPVGSLLVNVITLANGNVTFDDSKVNNILNMHDPIIKATNDALNVPHHLYFGESNDHRIELSLTLDVDNWATDDYTQYTTVTDISYTNRYVIYVNGEESALLSSIDRNTGVLTFQDAIYDVNQGGTPPSVKVTFLDVPETQGVLPAKLVGNVSAQQITKNTLDSKLFSTINHSGRIGETLIPFKTDASSTNNYHYSIPDSIGTATIYYDVISLPDTDSDYLAATNKGILQSSNAATEWSVVFSPPSPVIKLYYSSISERYFALTPTGVYTTADSLFTWAIIDGMVNSSITRDIAEDYLGNIYVSTNVGIYRFLPGEFTKDYWSQTSPINGQNPDAYAMRVSSGTLYASTSNGIFYTNDGGDTWTKDTSYEQNAAVFSFVEVTNAIFALTNDRLWRKKNTDLTYTEVAVFTDMCRKMQVFEDKLYITSNDGSYTTNDDLYISSKLTMTPAFQALVRNGKTPMVTSLNAIGTRMFVGTEEILFSTVNATKFSVQDESPNSISPTILIDNRERQIGVFWKAGASIVYFDNKVNPTSSVQIVTNYGLFMLQNGGWAMSNYQAAVNVRINSNQYVSSKKTLSMSDFGNFPLPDFSPRNSNYVKALTAYNNLVPYMNGFTDRANQQDQFGVILTPTNSSVSELFRRIEAFSLCLYPELQSQIAIPAVDVTFTRTVPTTNDEDTLDVTVKANATNGQFTITPQLDKYDHADVDILAVPIENQGSNTHIQVEDALEKANSGLPAGLSRVQQANLLKFGIRNKIKSNSLETHSGPFQSVLSTGCDSDWYDKFKSTIDYSPVALNSQDGISLPYAACVTEVPQLNQVWVGSLNGLLAIDVYTYAVTRINLPIPVDYRVNSIYTDGILVYVFTSEGLFTIDTGGNISKDVDLDLPNETNSLIVVRESYIAATPAGLYAKKAYETSWTKILDIKDAFLSASTSFIFCVGKNPNSINDTLAYSSVDGLSWSNRTSLTGIDTNAVTRSSYLIFFATTTGLYIEDLSRLLDPENNLPVIELVDLLDDTEQSSALNFNDVYADTTKVAAALPDGTYWLYENGDYTQVDSGIDIIHKIRIINGKVWVFGKDIVQIEDNAKTIRLATGAFLS